LAIDQKKFSQKKGKLKLKTPLGLLLELYSG
jgi:hypothetical protein